MYELQELCIPAKNLLGSFPPGVVFLTVQHSHGANLPVGRHGLVIGAPDQ